MNRSHMTVVEDQFGIQAAAYVSSAVHAAGEDLDALEAVAMRERPDRAIDLGSGGGHAAYRLAAHARCVTAVDLSAAMMDAVQATARQRGLENIETCVAPVEQLPFEDAAFDLLGCRFSAHHWRDFEQGLREARRVLKPGATAIFIDVVSPGKALFDTHLQAVELLRDPSHVRDYAEAEWSAALDRAGFRVRGTRKRRLRMEYQSWVERMRTPESHRAAIRSLQQAASAETATYFAIEPDGSFSLDTLEIEATACRARAM
ncbi:class I SAM-dependent methyltransferase [Sphingosinithalassobacter portus]|uniref:class I SAM-dependent methyltransferase n=1 Tax=Stakelama portus TaxID=2676234 RepID=UPI000D6E27C0|nr:class I SAM-dependent methyltransferase [Sphingosinithalassobacter portus]